MSRKTRNLIWAAPLVAVFAVIGALALFMAQTPNDASAQTLETPGQVQNFKAAATGPDTIKLTWDPPSTGGRASGYRIDMSADGLTWELLNESVPGQDDEYDHSGLMARQTKYYRIFAHNTGGTKIGPVALSTPASVTTMDSTKPGSPMDVTATKGTATPAPDTPDADTRTKITVRWAPPETPDGTKIHQYRIAYAQNPSNLSLGQTQDLTVSPVPTTEDDEVYCGADGTMCSYTFDELLEHETWHFQVYAVNMDAMGVVGTSNASDSKSATTDDGLLPLSPTMVWAAVNKNSPAVWLYWTPPDDPDGAPVTDYLIQGRPVTGPVAAATPWVNSSRNVRVFHNRPTSDLLLTAAELRGAALAAWQADDRLDATDRQLDDIANFETYFNNLEWEFRIFAINSVWKRVVQANPTKYDATLAGTSNTAATTANDDVLTANDNTAVNDNLSVQIDVSLNELNENDPATGTPPGVGDIAPDGVNLQMRIASVTATKDNQTNGGRTKIDLSWKRTYSHMTGDPAAPVYATEYRIQWSTNPDASEWMLLDQDGGTAGGGTAAQDDFTAAQADCDADDTCTVSHTGLTAGKTYTYRVFAMNAAGTGAGSNAANTVFSWWQIGSATTSQAEKPGRPTGLMANKSPSHGHTEIDLSWTAPIMDADGGGSGLGYGSLVKYVIQKSDDGGATWSELVRAKADFKKITYTHKGLMPGQTVRYRVATVNEGPRTKQSDWSDSATQTTEKSTKPDKPEGLVAEAVSATSIKLCWNIQSRTPPAAPILAYVVEYEKDGEWMQLARITDADADDNGNKIVRTMYTDTGLKPKETRNYRVRAENMPEVGMHVKSEESESAKATTPDAVVPAAPTGVTATANSDTQITVKWTAPANPEGAPVTGYIIERRYGDMMMDITSYNDDVMGAMHAFMDYKEWWETLDCDGMLQAANIAPADATDEQKGMYCKHFDNTAPTSMDFPADKEISEATAMKVKDLFMKRYVSDDMGKTTIVTGTEYVDMDLTAETEYSYRVSAVNAKGRSPWSAADSATTEATTPAAPLSVTGKDASAGTITIMWQAIDGAVRYHAIAYNRGTGEFDLKVGLDGTARETTFERLTEGTYAIGLIGEMADGSERLVLLPQPFMLSAPPPQLP